MNLRSVFFDKIQLSVIFKSLWNGKWLVQETPLNFRLDETHEMVHD